MMSQAVYEEDLQSHDVMELSDLQHDLGDHHEEETQHDDTKDYRTLPATEHKPLKAVMRRSNSSTNLSASQSMGGHATGVYASTGLSEHAKQQRLEKERHQQMEMMQRQVDLLEQKNLENIKQRRKLSADLESKMRECKFYEKQVIELTNENQHLKAQLESTIRVSSGVVGINTGVVGTLTGTKRGIENNPALSNKLGGAGGTAANNAKDALVIHELRTCREKLSSMETENKSYKIQNSELSMQVKILQDALNFRSEEIGLSGHADLLTKVAKLRGEVTALKNELTSKVEELTSVKEDKTVLDHQRQDLQSQIQEIQERLAQAQQETYRYSNSDIGQLLKSTEQERDLLIEYIQSDMQKSSTLAKQVETLEAELRISKKKANQFEEKWKEREEQWKQVTSQLNHLEKEYQQLRENTHLAQNQLEQIKIDRDSLQHQLDRKMLEEEELIKAQVTLFAQVCFFLLLFFYFFI
jgi:myosin heavy subunit